MIDQSLKTASVVATAEGKVTDERSDNRTNFVDKTSRMVLCNEFAFMLIWYWTFQLKNVFTFLISNLKAMEM